MKVTKAEVKTYFQIVERLFNNDMMPSDLPENEMAAFLKVDEVFVEAGIAIVDWAGKFIRIKFPKETKIWNKYWAPIHVYNALVSMSK